MAIVEKIFEHNLQNYHLNDRIKKIKDELKNMGRHFEVLSAQLRSDQLEFNGLVSEIKSLIDQKSLEANNLSPSEFVLWQAKTEEEIRELINKSQELSARVNLKKTHGDEIVSQFRELRSELESCLRLLDDIRSDLLLKVPPYPKN